MLNNEVIPIMTDRGIVFDIKKYSLHDGPGIRTTVFLKGCPLKCWWCHNPESQNPQPDVVEKTGRRREFHTRYSDNKDAIGREATVEEIMQEIEKDTIFYDESGGGVTFSGGEPLMQPDFLFALLTECKRQEFHTAIDTTGYAPFKVIDRMISQADLILYDLKLMDDEVHEKYTGVPGTPVLENLQKLVDKDIPITVRIPIVPGITDGDDNLIRMMDFLLHMGLTDDISLLPYNRFGEEKYRRLCMENRMKGVSPPSGDVMDTIKSRFEKNGFVARIGG